MLYIKNCLLILPLVALGMILLCGLNDGIHGAEVCTVQDLETLADRHPNLQELSFDYRCRANINLHIVNEFLPRFPRLKKLDLSWMETSGGGHLYSLEQLTELEELSLRNFVGLDDDRVFDQFIKGPVRKLDLLDTFPMTEAQILRLAEMPKLVDLEKANDHEDQFTDAVLRAIANRGQLKRFYAYTDVFTDDSIVYLVENCKSLVSLDVTYCRQITKRTLEAVVAEVKRRHGDPPRTLPKDPFDPEIFYFKFYSGYIDKWQAVALKGENPWLVYSFEGKYGEARTFY